MPHQNPPDPELKKILESAKRVAVVGASSNPARPSHGIFLRLQTAGYDTVPVNPRETEVLGVKAVATLAEVPDPVDIVCVFRRSEDTPPIAAEAVAKKAKVLWLQSGITSEEAAATAKAGGLAVVMDACIAVALARLGVADKR